MANLHDTFQIQRAANELNWLIQNGDITMDEDQQALWQIVIAGTSLNSLGSRSSSAEGVRTYFNSVVASSVGDARTIPDSVAAQQTATMIIATYNSTDPLGYGNTITNPSSDYSIAEWFADQGIETGKNDGWNASYEAMYDEIIAACAEQVARYIKNIDLSMLGDDYELPESIPWAAIGSAVHMAVKQLGSTGADTTPMWMNWGDNLSSGSASVVSDVVLNP
jgi:hypothetical protein